MTLEQSIQEYHQPRLFPISDAPNTLLYLGPSMNPTLQNLDVVYLIPYQDHIPRKGDVIAIRGHDTASSIIHRIVAITPEGLITQGDNNQQRDEGITQPSEVLGYISCIQRGNRQIPIQSGYAGYLVFVWSRICSTTRSWGKYILNYPYQYLVASQIFMRIASPFLVCRAVQYEGSSRSEIQLFLGPLYIGRRRKGMESWEIKPPFGIFFSSHCQIPLDEHKE